MRERERERERETGLMIIISIIKDHHCGGCWRPSGACNEKDNVRGGPRNALNGTTTTTTISTTTNTTKSSRLAMYTNRVDYVINEFDLLYDILFSILICLLLIVFF